jgi:hypothetical protein
MRSWLRPKEDQMSDPEPVGIERRFGWSNMFVAPEDDPRSNGATENSERAVLLDYLRHYRLTLPLKCADLTPEQLARRSVPPSTLSLLGLVRHMAFVEQVWFRIRMAGEEVPRLYRPEGEPAQDFDGAVGDPEVVAEAWATWRSEVEFAEQFVAGIDDLGFVGAEGHFLRDIIVHMIEEYARHCGHADLLRECIDGRVGQ